MSVGKKKIQSALFSLSNKEEALPLAQALCDHGVTLYATQGTATHFARHHLPVKEVEAITGYPPILGGRVKTLHPKIFGGILYRRDDPQDLQDAKTHALPSIDLVVVDLYSFGSSVRAGHTRKTCIENIDIGGVALLRAAAKNYEDVAVLFSLGQADALLRQLSQQAGCLDLVDRQRLSAETFLAVANYDAEIATFFQQLAVHHPTHTASIHPLRYGENPHQTGFFYGKITNLFHQHHGKMLSYGNLLDIEAALQLLDEFSTPTCVIIKHTNPCGVGLGRHAEAAFHNAYTVDSMAAFGGVFALNERVEVPLANRISALFYEVLIAPDYTAKALDILRKKKQRILLTQRHRLEEKDKKIRSVLGGMVVQTPDTTCEAPSTWEQVTQTAASQDEINDLYLAYRVVKHAKSNSIVLAKGNKIMGIGCGHVSRMDALQTALRKAAAGGNSLHGACMASEAFFPFPDCVDLAHHHGISAVVQPGGSVNDAASISHCNQHGMGMLFTKKRHFKH